MAAALLGEIFLARPMLHQATGMTEVELLNDIIAKSQVLANLESKWGEMSNRHATTRPGRTTTTSPNSRPGYKLAQEGAKATYPIIMVPGKI